MREEDTVWWGAWAWDLPTARYVELHRSPRGCMRTVLVLGPDRFPALLLTWEGVDINDRVLPGLVVNDDVDSKE